jgi:hypothetical protein
VTSKTSRRSRDRWLTVLAIVVFVLASLDKALAFSSLPVAIGLVFATLALLYGAWRLFSYLNGGDRKLR